ncbi:MAG: SPOR domain-containing protein [Bacteroidales bacterium]|nr:SPOR domain-containing protein [Bacteroidales bacterium]MBN2750378.1 SPOR domain-containing protein [Bacteroidales bacterium]
MTNKELSELIKQNTRTILPGFGAFLVKDSDKGFLAENVTFSPFLRYNDGMLEDYLAKNKGISKDEAGKQISSLTEIIKDELLNKGFFQIGELGFLNRDSRGTVSFTVGKATNSVAEKTKEEKPATPPKQEATAEGNASGSTLNSSESGSDTLDIISETELVQEETKRQEAMENKKTIESSAKVEPKTKPHTASKKVQGSERKHPLPKPKATKSVTTEPSKRRKTSPIVYIVAFAGIIVAIAASMLLIKTLVLDTDSTPLIDNSAKEKAAFAKEMEKVDKELGTPKEEPNTEQKPTQAPEPKTEKVQPNELAKPASEKVISQTQEVATSGNFHLVVGSFQNADYASSYAKELSEKGFGARVILRSNGMSAVTIGSFATYEAAKEDLARKKKAFPNGWVLKQ